MLSDDNKESNTAKIVNISIELKEYEETLLNKKIIRHKMKKIQSKNHKIGTYEVNKISLSCFDDKDLFQMMVFIHLLIFTKTQKNRFSQMIIKKKRFSQIKVSARI